MDKDYITLFSYLCMATESLAEDTTDALKDDKKKEAAKEMRQRYADLRDKLESKDFDPSTLERKDYAYLMVAAVLMERKLRARVEALTRTCTNYTTQIIPKLERMVKEGKDDKQLQTLRKELFQVSEKK